MTSKPFKVIKVIQVSPEIRLEYDIGDGWFSIVDKDAGAYDESGAVLMDTKYLDALIVALGQIRQEAEKNDSHLSRAR